MQKRINVSLPEQTVRVLDRAVNGESLSGQEQVFVGALAVAFGQFLSELGSADLFEVAPNRGIDEPTAVSLLDGTVKDPNGLFG